MVKTNTGFGSDAGFTIVEVLIAMIILSVGLLGMLGATASVVRTLGEADREVAAAFYSNERLEQLNALGCDQVSNGSETRQGMYALNWTVDGAANSPVRHVVLTTTYTLSAGRTRTDTLENALSCIR
ncbi:MAG: hypothetical protein AMS18_07210 [Gemmatimonas sp. SG8_17]|nr:MAG: hypothetical protein AMS18_07210 [Gemmatimonas sp. SG8_17]